MRLDEVRGGSSQTVDLRCADGRFDPIPSRGWEVSLSRAADETLLSDGTNVWPVLVGSPASANALQQLVGGALASVTWVVQSGAQEIVVEARSFAQEFRLDVGLDLGLDERIIDDLRRKHGVGGTARDLAEWLDERLFLPAERSRESTRRRCVIRGSEDGPGDAFRILGNKIAADVRRKGSKLVIERVVRGGQGKTRRCALLHAELRVVDATAAAELHGAVRETLASAVAGSTSYLKSWQEYQALEETNLARRASALGVHSYSRCRPVAGGAFRLEGIDTEALAEGLESLGSSPNEEFEAVPERSPKPQGESGSGRRFERTYRGRIVDHNLRIGWVELRGDDEEELPDPPERGLLKLAIGGDETRLKRRRAAEEALRTGNCPMPQLGLLMEGQRIGSSRLPKHAAMSDAVRDVFAPFLPTQRQIEALERALNTPDICLIQGPPGTGKTKVITALERRIAELADEGAQLNHRILVSAAQHDAVEHVAGKTRVFGLPAMKVGRRRGERADVGRTATFAHDLAQRIRAKLGPPAHAERLERARSIALVCAHSTGSTPDELSTRLRELLVTIGDLLTPMLSDRLRERIRAVEAPPALKSGDSSLLLKAARGIRVDAMSFSDDGPIKAMKALRRLDALLLDNERAFLKRCADCEDGATPDWIVQGSPIRDGIIDRLIATDAPSGGTVDLETQTLMAALLDDIDDRLLESRGGPEAAAARFAADLEFDPAGVDDAIREYTVVLASTLQQSAGRAMMAAKGISDGDASFDSVIIDEAARAHPLDLFIPLSRAERRVVLVGDHRQLPHLLEPDVERELGARVEGGTVDEEVLHAIRASLFEKLWVTLRKQEEADGIRRTVTLDAQYRMHPLLGKFVSEQFYEAHEDGPIESPLPAEHFRHDLDDYSSPSGAPLPAGWIDVRGITERRPRGAHGWTRDSEVKRIAEVLPKLVETHPDLTFGVISFYAAQVDAIGRALVESGLTELDDAHDGWRVADRWASLTRKDGSIVERFRVGTVDAFQGKEFDVVLLSVTRSNSLPSESEADARRKYGHLLLPNRLCVAMSRQQRVLVCVGDRDFALSADKVPALQAFARLCGGPDGIVHT